MAKSWSTEDMKSNVDYKNYDGDSNADSISFNEEKNKRKYGTFFQRFSLGLRSIWATKQTENVNGNRDLYIQTTLRELILYIIFLAILMMIAFGMTTGTMYWYTNLLNNLFLNGNGNNSTTTFSTMSSDADFWTIATGALLNGLYWNTWYNNLNLDPSEINFIFYENKLIGLPRMRQVRMNNNTCIIPTEFINTVNQCYASYKMSDESTNSFGFQNSTAWNYTSGSILGSYPFQGTISTYSGGGYYVDLPADRSSAASLLNFLYSNLWVDRGTRAVIIDFTVYNANINLFCAIKLVTEFPAVGGVIPTSDFKTIKLIRYVTPFDYFILGCELAYLIFLIYYTIEELIEIKIHKLTYFQSVWNCLDIIVISISFVCVVFNIYRTIAVQSVLGNLLMNTNQYPNFDYLSYNQTTFNYLLAVTVFLAWVKIFKYISFNKTMTQLSTTLGRCSKDLAGFAVMFFIIFFAFAQLGYLLFGAKLQSFRELHYCIFTLYRIILGDFTFSDFQTVHIILGPLYFILYVFFVFFVLFNMFLAIINDTYSEVKNELANAKNEFEIGDYFKERTMKMLEKLNLKKEKIVDIQNAITNADTNNDGLMDFDEWKAAMKIRGFDESEIESVFSKYDTDGNRVLDQNEQIEMQKQLENLKAAVNNEIMVEQSELTDCDLGLKKGVVRGVSIEQYNILNSRVEEMENNIISMVSKIDMVLKNLENMDKAKAKRRKAMGKILNTLTSKEHLSEEERKVHLETLVQEELIKLDHDTVLTQRRRSNQKSDS